MTQTEQTPTRRLLEGLVDFALVVILAAGTLSVNFVETWFERREVKLTVLQHIPIWAVEVATAVTSVAYAWMLFWYRVVVPLRRYFSKTPDDTDSGSGHSRTLPEPLDPPNPDARDNLGYLREVRPTGPSLAAALGVLPRARWSLMLGLVAGLIAAFGLLVYSTFAPNQPTGFRVSSIILTVTVVVFVRTIAQEVVRRFIGRDGPASFATAIAVIQQMIRND